MQRCIIVFLMSLLISCTSPFSEDMTDDTETKTLPGRDIHLSLNTEALKYLRDNPFSRGLGIPVEITIGTYSGWGRVKIHGGTSRYYSKKSLRLYFDSGPIERHRLFHPVFSCGTDESPSSVVLNAHSIDYSRIRNFLSLYTTRLLGGTAPAAGFARLFVNGEFYGFYSTIERVREEFLTPLLGHGAYHIAKAQDWNADFKQGSQGFESRKGPLSYLDKITDSLSYPNEEAIAFIRNSFSLEDLTAWFLACFYTGESDGYGKNYYLVYDRIREEVIFVRWDGDATFGRYWQGEPVPDHWHPTNIHQVIPRNAVIETLARDSSWCAEVREVAHSRIDRVEQKLLTVVTQLEEQYAATIQRDYALWNEQNESSFLETPWEGEVYWDYTCYEELQRSQFEEIRSYIRKRRAAFLEELDTLIELSSP
ncbi:CotH kinase family protein [Chitinivibrio alkaliphilus]|uniref:Spore coat protein CotH n=1 Tax=Chitinivibrio alkaliphilus ACht1 TaxID=1313304 RepID=U7D8G7_9BACT|nr:CotH kinase family protein [Chitinivibrio alkaliphilus]ERP30725.1 hypothetical protein CALK_2440 [Chitinivibrio alkaliphilus ACht1]